MEIEKIRQLLEEKDYDFLRHDPRLKGRLLFLALSGSHGYGTNNESSDVDIRGVYVDDMDSLLGFEPIEQIEDRATDTVIYSLTKFIRLAMQGNPNIIELFRLKEEHYLFLSEQGKNLLSHAKLFLSMRTLNAIEGFAKAQWDRAENASLRDGETLSVEKSLAHIAHSVQNACDALIEQRRLNAHIEIHPSLSDETIKLSAELHDVSIESAQSLMNEINGVLRSYKQNFGKNTTKKETRINKQLMHFIRLYSMGLELAETGDFHTYREKDHDLLMAIRNGDFRDEEGALKEEYITLYQSLTRRFGFAKANANLPKEPDKAAIATLTKEIFAAYR